MKAQPMSSFVLQVITARQILNTPLSIHASLELTLLLGLMGLEHLGPSASLVILGTTVRLQASRR